MIVWRLVGSSLQLPGRDEAPSFQGVGKVGMRVLCLFPLPLTHMVGHSHTLTAPFRVCSSTTDGLCFLP